MKLINTQSEPTNQGFPEEFKLPENMSDSRLYKQAGNSVCVSVIERIAKQIKIALKEKAD